MIKEEIKNLVEKAIKSLYKTEVKVKIDRPQKPAFGDYSTNIALILKKNPKEIAGAIKSPILEKIEVRNGFINFFISKEHLQKQIEEILKEKENFGSLKIGKEQKVNVEFISANPTGFLHVGNGRGAFFGDVLSNILEKVGYKVSREYYINDAKNSAQIKELGKTALGGGTTYLTENLKSQISRLRQDFGGQTEITEGEAGYLLAREVQKENQNFIEKKLKIKFDNWVSEEDFYEKSKIVKIYLFLVKKGLVYAQHSLLSWFKAESLVNFPPEPYKVAHWLKTKEFGDSKDEVIIRETGEPTYFLSDIAYHKDKIDRGFNRIINIWGADHQGHIPRIKAAVKILGYRGNLDILISQVVRLKSGLKLSKRKGQIIALEELIDEIGLDIARFFYLAKSLDTQMEFDLDLAKEQSEKNPVYYIQYAHARICSILRKVSSLKFQISSLKLLNHPSELSLVKQLIRFPEIVEDTAKDYQVQRIPQYALDLATVFHQFYRDCKVISEDKDLTKARVSLVLAAKTVLKNTLDLMGISAPEKM